MLDEETAEVWLEIRQIPMISNHAGGIVRLGGLTNRVYQVGDFVLRLAGAGTEAYINRAHEAEAARIAAAAGVSPEVLFTNPDRGLMVTRLVPDAVTMSPHLFSSRTGAPARAARALRQLHVSGGRFPFRFELFGMIDDYLKILGTKDVILPDGYHDVVKEADTVRHALALKPAPLAPCHCDPLCENFLDTGARMWIVDWEYSGMNDPMWDLGDLSVEGQFSEQQDTEMLDEYFGGAVRDSDRGRMVIYKAMCDLLWTLWGLIQLANNNPADNFGAYADNRFSRCKSLISKAEFSRHLRAIESG